MAKRNKEETKRILLESAVDLFSEKWYETVSAAEICRHSNLSNGIFYRYYKNKQDIFEKCLDLYVNTASKAFLGIEGDTVERRIESFIDISYKLNCEHKDIITVFREGQFRFKNYEERIRTIYKSAICKVFERNIKENEYIYFISGIRYLIIRSIYENINFDRDMLKEVIYNGFFDGSYINLVEVLKKNFIIHPLNFKDNTRDKLLKSGIELIGDKGFFNVDIADIVKRAGYSVGTFYINFMSKEEFLEELVNIIGIDLRNFLSSNIVEELSDSEKSLRALFLYLNYFNNNKEFYQIIREAEFVVSDVVTKYYDSFEDLYSRNLKVYKILNRKQASSMLVGLSHYSGIEYLFLDKIDDLQNFIKDISFFINNGIKK